MSNTFLWVEKYRPDKLRDIILPEKSKKIVRAYIKQGNMPPLLLHTRKPGSGKTTLARAIANEMESDLLFINGSKDGTMDELRGNVEKFASTVGLFAGQKVVVVDEADHISNKFSDAMRGVIEAFHSTCVFIFTCNHLEKIIEPIQSRTQAISFEFNTKEEIYGAKIKIFKRIEKILKAETVEYDPETIIDVINRKFPDIRSIINLLQRESQVEGRIDKSVIDRVNDFDIEKVYTCLKGKKWKELRTYFTNNSIYNIDIYRELFDNAEIYIDPKSIANAIVLIAKYNYRSALSVDQEINLSALMIEMMGSIEYK